MKLIDMILSSFREKHFKHCTKCGSILSEWFIGANGGMRCYPCGTVSKWTGHGYTYPSEIVDVAVDDIER